MRVHELAKKLGLKSQDLIDRIQKEGLDVKPSGLAGLDPEMVERIEQLYQEPNHAADHGATMTERTHAGHTEKRAETGSGGSSTAVLTPPSERSRGASALATAPRSRPTQPAAELEADSRIGAKQATARPSAIDQAGRPHAAQTGQHAASPLGGTRPTAPAPVSEPSRSASGPLSAYRSGGGGRGGAGPLSGHTPHRGALPASGSREGQGMEGGGAASTGPLRRSDYISPSGTRPISASGRPASIPSGQKRPTDAIATEVPKRDVAGSGRVARPLPPVAATPSSLPSAPRRPSEPGRSAGPESKTQRPDRKFTAEELLQMSRGGQIGGKPGQSARAPGPGARGAAPAARPAGDGRGAIGPRGAIVVEEEEDRGAKAGHGPGQGRLGSEADRARRRADRSKRAMERRGIASPMPVSALIDEEDSQRSRRGLHRAGKGHRTATIAPRKTHAVLEPPITVRGLSEAIGIKAGDLLKKLWASFDSGATINSAIDEEVAMELAMEFGVEVTIHHARTAEDDLLDSFGAAALEGDLVQRPPVVTVLGHVDHGKTSLLDRIRQANVVASESGGITQHIGAYQITHNDRKITFVDTPGHEAFTAMRARGANVTDIVVLVVAADDGVMPQTVEAIAHARAAEVPVVVALSKIDLPNVQSSANINKIYGELAQQGLNPHEWGGETEVVKTSVVTGAGIDDLLLTLELLAESMALKADPARPAVGTCLEASLSEGRGVMARVLVQDGTLRVGDVMVCGDGYGRVRALYDDLGNPTQQAGPSTPVEVSGLDAVPTAGEKFAVIENLSQAREIAQSRRARGRGAIALGDKQALTLENVYSKMTEKKVKSLNLIIKADVQGSLEAISKELEKLKNDEVPIRILLKAVGGISESDVSLAEASQAIIIGFRVAPEDRAFSLADEKKIDIRRYDIIYQVTDEIKKAVEGMLVPEVKEVFLGRANVRQVFKISKVGTVAGCHVTQGVIERNAKARIIREGVEIYKSGIDALKRFKDDVKEVREGFECGIKITNYDDIKVGDTIEAYRMEVIRRTL